MREAGYPDKRPTAKPPIEQISVYPGKTAPAAARSDGGVSTVAGVREATEARRANQAVPAQYGRKS